jgi:hypothetical protein
VPPALKSGAPPAEARSIGAGGTRRNLRRALVAAGVALAAAAPAAAIGSRTPGIEAQRMLAQERVLSALARSREPRRIAGLVDPRTRLPLNGTQVRCHGFRWRPSNARRGRFTCVLRPAARRSARFRVGYRVLSTGRFRVRWLGLERG